MFICDFASNYFPSAAKNYSGCKVTEFVKKKPLIKRL